MKITIICVGKIKEKYFRDAILEYQKRLTRYCKLEIIELPEQRLPDAPSAGQIEMALKKESELIESKIPSGATVIAMCIEGKTLSSEALARVIEEAGKNHALTYFVLEEVCRAMAENPELSHMRALIDLPLSQLANGELLHRINEITARYRISHDNIIFRISEQITLPALEAQRDALRAICAMNYSFHIVNFGASGVRLQTMLALGARCVWLDDLLISSTDESALSHLIAWLRESGLFVALEEKASVYSDALLERFKPDYLCAASYAPPMNPEELLARLKAEK